ncbi:MAG: hypothetical protein HRJ53_22020 [Acidobacteria bacterium Pan2503]|uniref:Uncharacterized protein n=1 Tax=Candidatus Acidiferrum panamense TaxID=2741543 RepID=A0A7V8NUG6_9BACT|nr:hypothetical protein [Candidatus Acidoferrum panamensis]
MAIGIEQTKAKLQTQVDTAVLRLAGGRGSSFGGANLDNYGMWAAAKIAAGGNTAFLQMMTSRWASPQRAEIFNMMAKEWAEQGIDPSVVTQGQITVAVEKKAQTWSVMRWEAMNRLEVALTELKPAIDQAIAAANQLRPRAWNTPINKLTKEFTAGPQAAKIAYANTLALTVGREYITLATMPVSNAQMHWSAQDQANKMVSGDMSLYELSGFYEALSKEIHANKAGLEEATRLSMQDVMSLGRSVRPEDFGLPGKAPQTDEQRQRQWEQQYAPTGTRH